MTWTWDEIDANWLGDSVIAEDPGVVLEAFKRIDMTLGPDWIDNYRADRGGGDHRGAGLTLPLVILGKQLAQIEGAAGCEGLVRGLRDGRPNARAELDAISLLMEGPGDIRLECEPSVLVGGRERKADFRVSKVHEEWVYGEVTQPNRSATEESLTRAMDEVADVVSSLDGSYATEVFFDDLYIPGDMLVAALSWGSSRTLVPWGMTFIWRWARRSASVGSSPTCHAPRRESI